MADRAINQLEAATSVGATDLFVLQQNNIAKKLTGQKLEDWLLTLAEAYGGITEITGPTTQGLVDTYTIHYAKSSATTTFTVTNGEKGDTGDTGPRGYTGNGIASILKTATSGIVDIYTVTYTDGDTDTIDVTNGNGITSVSGPSTSGLNDTYTLNFDNGSTGTFVVKNGKGISSVTEVDVTHAAGHVDIYDFMMNDNTAFRLQVYNGQNGADGTGSVSTVDEIAANQQNVSLMQFGQVPPTSGTVGAVKSRYYDRTHKVLYICVGVDTSGVNPTYDWQVASTSLPDITSADNGKVLMVQNGQWTVANYPVAAGVSF